MIAKTKKFQLDPNKYIMLASGQLFRKQWYYAFAPITLGVVGFFIPWTGLWLTLAILALILYPLFRMAQFAGITKAEQSKMLFEKVSYEIDSRQILIKLNPKMGSPISWDLVKSAEKGKDHFLLVMGIGQFLYLPFNVFQNQNGVQFTESILKRKELLK